MQNVASIEPICAHLSWLKPQASPATKPDRKQSPTPVGSILNFSLGTPTVIGSLPCSSTRAPLEPRVITRTATLLKISASLQPVFWIVSASSYSFKNKYFAPSINNLIASPSMRANCCEGSAANAIPISRALWLWLNIASGSSGEIISKSNLPAFSIIGANSISRASLIAPGKNEAI